MTYIIIDAASLACPRAGDLPQATRHAVVGRYVSRLADLSRLRTTCRSTAFLRDKQLPMTLHELGCYPFRASLNEALSLCSDEFDVQIEDVNRLANFLVERSDLIEDIGGYRDVAVEKCCVTPEFQAAPPPRLLAQLTRMMALVALAKESFGRRCQNMFLVTGLVPDSQGQLSFHIVVTLAERQDGSIVELAHPLSITVPIYADTVGFLRSLNVSVLLQQADVDALIDSCVAVAVRDEAEPDVRALTLSSQTNVGKDFLQSASRLGFLHEPSKILRLLRACADILLGRNLAKSHHLRTGEGANNPQRMRGDFGAWRHDLDDEFHLHYWRKGSTVEFANIVVHNDFDITY